MMSQTEIMIEPLPVMDFRSMESWNEARLLVCLLLDLTKSFSATTQQENVAAQINGLSISILDDIARAYESGADRAFMEKARRSLDLLERQLDAACERRFLNMSDSDQALHILGAVRQSLTDPSA